MKVLVTGSHGLVGSQLTPFLETQGHQVVKLVRHRESPDELVWDPDQEKIDHSQLEGFDAVVHLAGDNIASSRWTARKKANILTSRVNGTKLLCKALSLLDNPPAVLISSSAVGYYGNRADEVLNEESSAGSGFLADVCQKWESATSTAQQKGIRVVQLRTGVVLSSKGGALAKMLPPFLIGAGGKLGSGKQYMSWISLDDLVAIIYHVLLHKELNGPVNAVTPNPVTNIQFTAALAQALHRPALFPVPALAIHMLLGEMADELLLASTRVYPDKLLASGYSFRHPELSFLLQQFFKAV